MKDAPLALRVHVPVACFREPYGREYIQTFPAPPPSTVYGMLLSMVGEEDRYRHIGARLALGRLSAPRGSERRPSRPQRSEVVRTFYRWKKSDINHPSNRAPNIQQLLTDVRVVVWLEEGEGEPEPSLKQRVAAALEDPGSVERYGALCLGESSHMVDGVWRLEDRPILEDEVLEVLDPVCDGSLNMPIWADHVGSKGTRWGSYRLSWCQEPLWEPGGNDWTTIAPPG